MTALQALEISEKLEMVYAEITSRLLVNLAKYFDVKKDTDIDQWEQDRLNDIDKIFRESISIVADGSAENAALINDALHESMDTELAPLDKMLNNAVKEGKVERPISEHWESSERIYEQLKNFAAQVRDKTNLVNSTMLASTREAYLQTVQTVAQDFKAAQEKLESSVLSVFTENENYTTAVRKAIRGMADKGITGFIDRAGRHWSPEAYVNMVTRTTIHNTAIAGQRERSAEYGVTTFQIGPNKPSRPLCAPYVGWICSWDGSSGTIHDLDGNAYEYVSIFDTSYGEPAGIFGINCGHSPFTFVDGYSVPRYHEMTPEELEENERLYQLSQTQRKLEREVRKAKTLALAYKAAGDNEAFSQAAVQVRRTTDAYRAFCKGNDRTERVYNTQVVGYNRSVAQSTVKAAKNAMEIQLPSGRIAIQVQRSSIVGLPNSVTQITSKKGGITRNFYGDDGNQILQISNNDHGHTAESRMGLHGEHAHDYYMDTSTNTIKHGKARELTARERKENSDIL